MKPTVFFVIDTETCRFDGMVFDIGWKAIDRKGREYSQGSYLRADVLETDTPYYRKKIAAYWFKVNKSITAVRFSTVRNIFNQEISRLQNKGHRCVVCAYNAAFDQSVLDSRLYGNPNGTDISSLYLEDGYLIFTITSIY